MSRKLWLAGVAVAALLVSTKLWAGEGPSTETIITSPRTITETVEVIIPATPGHSWVEYGCRPYVLLHETYGTPGRTEIETVTRTIPGEEITRIVDPMRPPPPVTPIAEFEPEPPVILCNECGDDPPIVDGRDPEVEDPTVTPEILSGPLGTLGLLGVGLLGLGFILYARGLDEEW